MPAQINEALLFIKNQESDVAIKLFGLEMAMDRGVYQETFYAYLDVLYAAVDVKKLGFIRSLLSVYRGTRGGDIDKCKIAISKTKELIDDFFGLMKPLSTKQSKIELQKEFRATYFTIQEGLTPDLSWRKELGVNENIKHVVLEAKSDLIRKVTSFQSFEDKINLMQVSTRLSEVLTVHGRLSTSELYDDTDDEFMRFNRRPVADKNAGLSVEQLITLISRCSSDVTQVNFSGESKVTCDVLKYLLTRLPNIRSLNLSDCYGINEDALSVIAKYGIQIERLNLSKADLDNVNFTEWFPGLKALRFLKVDTMSHRSQSSLQQLMDSVASNCPNIEMLNCIGIMSSNLNYIETICLKPVLTQCKRLRGLALGASESLSGSSNHFRVSLPDADSESIVENLEYLRIENCESDLLVKLLNHNRKVKSLSLSRLDFLPVIMEFSFSASALTELRLDSRIQYPSNQVGPILRHILSSSKIARLSLESHYCNDEIINDILQECTKLQHIELSGNDYSVEVFSELLRRNGKVKTLGFLNAGEMVFDYISALQDKSDITSLVFIDCRMSRHLLRIITKNCPNLVNLEFFYTKIESRINEKLNYQCSQNDVIKMVKKLGKLTNLGVGSRVVVGLRRDVYKINDEVYLSSRREMLDYFLSNARFSEISSLDQIERLIGNYKDNCRIIKNDLGFRFNVLVDFLGERSDDKDTLYEKCQSIFLLPLSCCRGNVSEDGALEVDFDALNYILDVIPGLLYNDFLSGNNYDDCIAGLFHFFKKRYVSIEEIQALSPEKELLFLKHINTTYEFIKIRELNFFKLKKAELDFSTLVSDRNNILPSVLEYCECVIRMLKVRLKSHLILNLIETIVTFLSKKSKFVIMSWEFKRIMSNLFLQDDNGRFVSYFLNLPGHIQDWILNYSHGYKKLLEKIFKCHLIDGDDSIWNKLILGNPKSVIALSLHGVGLSKLQSLSDSCFTIVSREYESVLKLLRSKIEWHDIVGIVLVYKEKSGQCLQAVYWLIRDGLTWESIRNLIFSPMKDLKSNILDFHHVVINLWKEDEGFTRLCKHDAHLLNAILNNYESYIGCMVSDGVGLNDIITIAEKFENNIDEFKLLIKGLYQLHDCVKWCTLYQSVMQDYTLNLSLILANSKRARALFYLPNVTFSGLMNLDVKKLEFLFSCRIDIVELMSVNLGLGFLEELNQDHLTLILKNQNFVHLMHEKFFNNDMFQSNNLDISSLEFIRTAVGFLDSKISQNEILNLDYKKMCALNPRDQISSTLSELMNRFDLSQTSWGVLPHRFISQANNNVLDANERCDNLFRYLLNTKDRDRSSNAFFKSNTGRSSWMTLCRLLDLPEEKLRDALQLENKKFRLFVCFHYVKSSLFNQSRPSDSLAKFVS